MAHETKKKSLPDDLLVEVYRLSRSEGWSNQQISDWLSEQGYSGYSREWVRRACEAMDGTEGEVVPDIEDPAHLDDDGQLLSIQHTLYRVAHSARKRGDVADLIAAAKAHRDQVIARKRLREAGPQTVIVQGSSPSASAQDARTMTQAEIDAALAQELN
jgi:hypothetical protein